MTLHRRAWTMQLREGAEADYDAAHAAVWPELLAQMNETGIRQFYLFRSGTTVFAFQERDDPFSSQALEPSEITRRWWHEMQGLMVTDAEGRPVHFPLSEVFAMTAPESER